ncbi:MAG TPA: A24 family peptidase [Nevskiaceae bacterium]|nr:A24 family peptidase [Nevskiaceae bacterium]
MSATDALQAQPWLLIAWVALFGLVLGSFLNVVILRLPRMLENAWHEEARAALQLPARPPRERISLHHPPSTCPSCGARIRAWQNVPVVSWLVLRGRCASCRTPISIQYPIVELVSGVTAALCAWRFGYSAQLLAALALTGCLIALSVIDLRTQLLPDAITLPLLWLGLLIAATSPLFCDLKSAIFGAVVGYLALWSVYWLFKLIMGKEGMGYGDFKLLAALGAWLGWQALLPIVLISSFVGAAVGIALITSGRLGRQVPMPFGPFLATAGWIMLIWGDAIRAAMFPTLR